MSFVFSLVLKVVFSKGLNVGIHIMLSIFNIFLLTSLVVESLDRSLLTEH